MKHKLLWGIGIVALGVGGLFLLGSTDTPDCGSQATRDLIAKIAKDHPGQLLATVYSNSAQKRKDQKAAKAKIRVLQKQNNDLAAQGEGLTAEGINNIKGKDQWHSLLKAEAKVVRQYNSLMSNETKNSEKLWNKAHTFAKYNLDTIRTTSVNSQTGAVVCAAKLHVDVPEWGKAKQDIKYRVERTSNGNLYATLYGFGQ